VKFRYNNILVVEKPSYPQGFPQAAGAVLRFIITSWANFRNKLGKFLQVD